MRTGFNVKGAILRTMMVLVITAIGLCLVGCGEEMAKLEEKQLNLQAEIEANARQIAALGNRIEQNQQQLRAGIKEVQNNIVEVASDTAAVSRDNMKFQDVVKNTNRQTTNKITLLEQNQSDLQTKIEDMRNNTQNFAADTGTDIANVKDEQARLYETVQSNSRQFTNNMAEIEQNQQQWQSRIEELQQNFQEATTKISTLGDDLLKLQETLQSNIRELSNMMDLSGKEQLKFQEKIQQNLLAVDSTISAIKQSQKQLQSQIENVRSRAETMSTELPAAIEQLREEVARNSPREKEDNQPPPETDSAE